MHMAAAGLILSIGGIAVLMPGELQNSSSQEGASSATLATGEAVYQASCASCHGANLEGQPDWQERRPDGRLPAPPHDASGHTWHHSDQLLFDLTKFGVEAYVSGDYQSDMPAFEGVLDDQEIVAVIEYIKSTWPQNIRDMQGRRDVPN